ncbi:MAG: phage protein Gp27 family protein, partial [Aeromonas sp.]
KIEKQLTPEEVVELLETLARTPGGVVLATIKEEARKRGIEISLMGATTFRDNALNPYLNKLRAARQKSEMLAEALLDGDEDGLLASARTMMAERINDLLMNDDEELSKGDHLSLAKSLNLLSGSNQGDRMTRARLREYEAKEAERNAARELLEQRKNAAVDKGGLSDEVIALMEDTLQLLG